MSFRLQSTKSSRLTVALEFSEDGGMTFHAASARAGVFDVSRDATPGRLIWDARKDLGTLKQHDLKVRVTPFDPKTGRKGSGAESEVFGMGTDSPPRVTSIVPPALRVGGSVPFRVEVADDDLDHVTLEAQFALSDGFFRDAAIEEAGSMTATRGNGASAVVVIHWNAQADVPESSARSVRFRVRARDTQAGEYAITVPFELDTVSPLVSQLSIEDIEEEMNGSVPFTNREGSQEAFGLLVPSHGFTITLRLEPAEGGSVIDPASLSVKATQPFGRPGSPARLAAGAELASFFNFDASLHRASWTVDEEHALPSSGVTLSAEVSDVLGNRSEPRTFTFSAVAATSSSAPFEREDDWLLDFERDHFTITSSIDSQRNVTLESVEQPNGIADYEEDLAVLGLAQRDAAPGSEAAALNEKVLDLTKETIRGYVNGHYGRSPDGSDREGSVRIRFHLTPPPSSHSRISIGGDDPLPGYTIGRAEYDSKNSKRNDNSAADLGIFTTNLIEFHVNVSYLFRHYFDPFIPGRGTPIGESSLDAVVLGDSYDRSLPGNDPALDARHDEIVDAVDAWARMVALVTAHEIGHSVGLVANGSPSHGLFGGEVNASFAGPFTNAYHLDTAANDIMASSLSFADALLDNAAGPRFTRLSMAYLLGRVRLR